MVERKGSYGTGCWMDAHAALVAPAQMVDDSKVTNHCVGRYLQHPKGCPNYLQQKFKWFVPKTWLRFALRGLMSLIISLSFFFVCTHVLGM